MAEEKSTAVAPVEQRPATLLQQMEREFEDMRRRTFELFRWPAMFRWPGITPYRRLLTTEAAWAPTADAYIADGTMIVEAELPGVKKEDVSISVTDNVLTIEGKREEEKEVKGARYYASERFGGAFSRAFALPDGVDAGKIEAEFKDGVLKVKVPLPATAKAEPVKIAVKS